MSIEHKPSTSADIDRWTNLGKSMVSAVAGLDLGTDTVGPVLFLRMTIDGYTKKCTDAMSNAAHSLAEVHDMGSLLAAATEIDTFHKTLEAFAAVPTFMASEHPNAAHTLNTAIQENLVEFESQAVDTWLDSYAEYRPGEKIVRRDNGTEKTDWHSLNDLRITLGGPSRECHLQSRRTRY